MAQTMVNFRMDEDLKKRRKRKRELPQPFKVHKSEPFHA